MKQKEIHRTATFAWSPSLSIPLLASGTVAGALDESFSNDSQLEIWAPNFMDKTEYDLGGEGHYGPKASVTTNSRFNRIAWGSPINGRSKGILAAGMENGELGLWDPEKILTTSDVKESLILRNTTHQGSVRGLDFNPIQTNLLTSGAVNGEIYIWDLKDPSKPYSPGTRSSKLDDITSLAWNRQVQYVLASSSNTGYTVVWDLRNKREVVALAYGGVTQGAVGAGGRKGMSDVAWHPDNATRLVTSSEDDASPVVMVWDLRNARAPEKILSGHEKGVLSLSWCKQDSDLLLSCGKDNRVLCWNPQSAEVIGELPSAENWAFEVQWCPRNPDLFAAAYFDGTIGIHSLQTTNEHAESAQISSTPKPDGSDVFDVPGYSRSTQATLSLKQPPKWLRRPVSASFGYGGKVVSVSNLPSSQGKNQSSVVHIRKVVTEPSIVDRAKQLKEAAEKESLHDFAKERSKGAEAKANHDAASWRALSSLFQADSRDELVSLLGFSKAQIASRVSEAVEKIRVNVTPVRTSSMDIDLGDIKPHEPVVSFAEPETPPGSEQEVEPTPSEQSASVTSDRTESTRALDGESTTTAPSLFGDDIVGTPQTDAEADFFSTMGTIRGAIPEHMNIPHQNYAHDSSVAATIGSRPSSAASEGLKNNTFRIYPSEESDIDLLVTKSLVLGDFESAVTLCLSSERYADAILLAVKGGPDLLQRTQKAYFEKRTVNFPYLRLFQSIVTEDLDDIVQNADLQEWQEIFVVLCTFAKADEFANLAEQLGQRLEFAASLAKTSESAGAEELRKNATLTYLAAGRLEKVVNIWIEEMAEEESRLLAGFDEKSSSRYSAHAHALQTFMEKVAVFRSAKKYDDADLSVAPDASTVRPYKLSGLYERYYEYADLLATQGLLEDAIRYLKLVPADYQSSSTSDVDFKMARERILSAASTAEAPKSAQAPISQSVNTSTQSASYPYSSYATSAVPAPSVPAPTTQYEPYKSAAPSTLQSSNTYPSTQTVRYTSAAPMQTYSHTPYSTGSAYAPPAQAVQIPAPPPPITSSAPLPPPPSNVAGPPPAALPPPPSRKKENGGWNDAPLLSDRRTPSTQPNAKPAAITAPFPNASPISVPGSPVPSGAGLPPPPRPGSVQRGPPGPPLGPGLHRPPSTTYAPPPPGRAFSPAQASAPAQLPPPPRGPAQFPPGQAPPMPPQQPPQNLHRAPPQGQQFNPHQHHPRAIQGPGMAAPYGRGTPPPGWVGPEAQGPYQPPPPASQQTTLRSPPPQQVNPGPYGPPPGAQRGAPPGHMTRGPPPAGPQGPSPRAPPPAKQEPQPPKYRPGDRSHIPATSKRAYEILTGELNRLKQNTPPQQRRLVDDTENRLNVLFDALNNEALSTPVSEQLNDLTEAIAVRDQRRALEIHLDLLTQGSRTDDIGLWMSAVKQLIIRL